MAPQDGYQVCTIGTPVGPLWVLYVDAALVAAEFGSDRPTRFHTANVAESPAPKWIVELFRTAFQGTPLPPWPAVDWGFTQLERTILSKATEVPFGTTISYGALANWAGFPRRARAAGRAMSRSPIVYLIPTHRVIRADGHPAPCQRDPLNAALRQCENIDLGPRDAMIDRTR